MIKKEEKEIKNQKSVFGSIFSFIGFRSEYFDSEWSFAQYHLDYKGKSLVAFSKKNNNIIIVNYDGKYFLGEFDENLGKECKTSTEKNFLHIENNFL